MPTTTLSQTKHASARKYEALILQQLADIGQRSVANAPEVHDSTISRMKNGEIEALCRFLEALELKVVKADAVTACPKYLAAVETLAAIGLEHESNKQTRA